MLYTVSAVNMCFLIGKKFRTWIVHIEILDIGFEIVSRFNTSQLN